MLKILIDFQVAHAPVRTHTLTTEEQRLAVREHIFPHNSMFSPFKCFAFHFNLTPSLVLLKTSMITLTLTSPTATMSSSPKPGKERSALLPTLVPRGTCSRVRSGTRRVWPHLHVQVATEDSNDYDLPYYKCCQ